MMARSELALVEYILFVLVLAVVVASLLLVRTAATRVDDLGDAIECHAATGPGHARTGVPHPACEKAASRPRPRDG